LGRGFRASIVSRLEFGCGDPADRFEKALGESRYAEKAVVFTAGMLRDRPGDHFAMANEPDIARTIGTRGKSASRRPTRRSARSSRACERLSAPLSGAGAASRRPMRSTLPLLPLYCWTEERIRAHALLRVLAPNVERATRKTLAGTGTSVPVALEMLGRVRAGSSRVGRKPAAFLTNVGKPSRECRTRLGVKVADVANVATATLPGPFGADGSAVCRARGLGPASLPREAS